MPDVLHRPVSISHTAYEVLWERASFGMMPPSIAIDYPLRSMDSGAALARNAFAELNRNGLADGDQIHPDLHHALRNLTSEQQRYASIIINAANPYGNGSFIAVEGDTATLATLDDQALHLSSIEAAQAVPALLSTLPRYAPGHGRSLTFREDEITADGRKVEPAAEAGSVLVATNLTATDADRYLALMRDPRLGTSYLYPPRGKPIMVVDLEREGRWFVDQAAGWITAAPGTAAALTERLCQR